MLRIHQYRVCTTYKPDLDLYIAHWLSWNNHTENRDQEIPGRGINVNAISTSVNMPLCTSIEDIQAATQEGTNQQKLKSYIIQGWPHTN